MIFSDLSLKTFGILVGSVAALCAVQFFLDLRRLLRSINHHPGYGTLFSSTTVFGNIFSTIPWVALGYNHSWRVKHAPFAERGLDIISAVSFWPIPIRNMYIADVQAIKDIVWSRERFPKDLSQYAILNIFGDNIIASDGDEWKRYHKVVARAFSEKNNRLVWETTTQIMIELFDTVWTGKDEVVVDHAVNLTLPVALFVIGAAGEYSPHYRRAPVDVNHIKGFGHHIPWKDDAVIPPGHQLTFKDALFITSHDVFIKFLVPRWAMGFTKRFRRARLAFDELQRYLTEMIQERKRSQLKADNEDLFTSLLAANDDENLLKDEVKLNDSELIGNIYMLMVAGHETTGHSLAFALALLALYPDKQEELYQHIKRVLPDGRIPTYDDMSSLSYSSAVFNEALRMFPPV
ncbi:cytochrome P450, partial [Rhizopogon vinicolor AM-OR11-026]